MLKLKKVINRGGGGGKLCQSEEASPEGGGEVKKLDTSWQRERARNKKNSEGY